jgi:hypothetical protein
LPLRAPSLCCESNVLAMVWAVRRGDISPPELLAVLAGVVVLFKISGIGYAKSAWCVGGQSYTNVIYKYC